MLTAEPQSNPWSAWLAQGPPDPKSESAPGTAQPAGGNAAPGGGQAPPPSPFTNPMFILIIVVGIFIVMSLLGQRRDRKRREEMLSSIKKHDKVQTLGGVVGAVVEVKSDQVVLKVDESTNTRITFARSAIQHVLNEDKDAAATS